MLQQQEQYQPEEPPQGLALLLENAAKTVSLRVLKPQDYALFLQKHTERRENLPEDQQGFMKKISPELIDLLKEKSKSGSRKCHTVVGLFCGDQMVAGCIALYPCDDDISTYLDSYDFGEHKDSAAVISAVWTDSNHLKKGYNKQVIDLAMDLAILDGKDAFFAKVDRDNAPSLALFEKHFEMTAQETGLQKLYPHLKL